MIEIAISLAVIGFALVAIIGILPSGMEVQKQNREETIINQDANFLMNVIRNGARGVDDLTNYVTAITNYQTKYSYVGGKPVSHQYGYTFFNSSQDGAPTPVPFRLTNGFRIVGLLSTPKYIPYSFGKDSGFYSNHVVAFVRSMSGPASEKFPQNNEAMLDLGLSYRLISEVIPYAAYDASWTNYSQFASNSPAFNARLNYWIVAKNLQANLQQVRLLFRWPLLPNGKTGNGRQSFQTMADGPILTTNDFGFPQFPLYFIQPQTYTMAP